LDPVKEEFVVHLYVLVWLILGGRITPSGDGGGMRERESEENQKEMKGT
jgi:hypothetical protein